MNEGQTHLNKTEARAGSTEHVVRYVLLASLALAVIVLATVLLAS